MDKKNLLNNFILIILYSLIFLTYSKVIYAANYRADYKVEYFLVIDNKQIDTKTNFNIQITNLRSDVYVNKFSILFPKNFVIKDLKASDDLQEITPKVTTDESETKIDMEFSHPNTGKDTVNNFYLQFTQTNLFEVNGNVWEVILPTIVNREEGNYKIIVNLPKDNDKKISIAKPRPSSINGSQIIWDNPSNRTVYAVFGNTQLYDLRLSYHLNNPNLFPVYIDVAFPPDTEYQKIYVQSINPQPSLVFTDEDGNYMGRYFLKPHETIPLSFQGVAELSVKPREEVLPTIRNLINTQGKYLLTDDKYWRISQIPQSLDSSNSIYQYTVNTLKYNYNKVINKNDRLGAFEALQSPNNAVCVEFSDVFIALAREKGIFSREIEGFGFTKDPHLRPLSLVSDVLHSWPEFYDTNSQIWIDIDPTWENTSGIDYFNSFDLNHVVFAIHGKKSDYPLPAGMYKTEDSRDVSVTATTIKPNESKNIEISSLDFPRSISDNRVVNTKIVFVNKGNVYLWNVPIKFESKVLNFTPSQYIIPVLAPYEKKELAITYSSMVKNQQIKDIVHILAFNNEIATKQIAVIPYTYELALKISFFIAFFFFIILLLKIYTTSFRRKTELR